MSQNPTRNNDINAAANAAAAFNNFASTIEEIVSKLTGDVLGIGGEGKSGSQGLTIQDQINDLTVKNTELALQVSALIAQLPTVTAQLWSHDVLLVSIKAGLDNLNSQVAALAGLADPFQQPHRMGGPQQPD